MTADVGAYGNGSLVVGAMLCDRYRIDDFLGIGGMGVVVAATDAHAPAGSPSARVAVKLLRDELVSKAHIVERFLREARAVLRLTTDHVCKVFDIARLPMGAPIIVMEYLDGVDLARTMLRQPLPSTIAVEYVMQACVALAEAHAKGVIHRDLKPANLFVIRRPDGGPMIKVLDFGIAKALFETDAALTRTRMVMGSPGYMSPEQIESAKDVDQRTDLWALGVTLYQLLSTKLPFPGRNATEIAVRVASDPPAPLDAEPAIVSIIMRCLAKRPEERYRDVVSLAHDLAPYGGPSGRHIAAMVVEASRRGPSGSVSAQVVAASAHLGAMGGPASGQLVAAHTMPSGFVPAQPPPSTGIVPSQPPSPGSSPAQSSGGPQPVFVQPHAPTAASGSAMPVGGSNANAYASAPPGNAPHANAPQSSHADATPPSASPTTSRARTGLYVGIVVAAVLTAVIIVVALARGSNRSGEGHTSEIADNAPSTSGSNSAPDHTAKPGSNREPGSNHGPSRTDAPGSNGSAVDPWGPRPRHANSPGDSNGDGTDDGDGDGDGDSHDDLDALNGALDALDSNDGSNPKSPGKGSSSTPHGATRAPNAGGDIPQVTVPIDMSKLPNVPGMTKQQLQQSFQQAAVACKQLLDGKMPVAVPIEAQATCACMIRDAVRAQGFVDKAPDSKKPTLRRTCAQFGISLK